MKNIFVKLLFISALLFNQFAFSQSTAAKADADETPEKAAMKMQLRENNKMQHVQIEKQQQATKKTTAVSSAKQPIAVAGSVGVSKKASVAGSSKTALSQSTKGNQVSDEKPLGGVTNEKLTAAPGTILDKQSADKPAGKK